MPPRRPSIHRTDIPTGSFVIPDPTGLLKPSPTGHVVTDNLLRSSHSPVVIPQLARLLPGGPSTPSGSVPFSLETGHRFGFIVPMIGTAGQAFEGLPDLLAIAPCAPGTSGQTRARCDFQPIREHFACATISVVVTEYRSLRCVVFFTFSDCPGRIHPAGVIFCNSAHSRETCLPFSSAM